MAVTVATVPKVKRQFVGSRIQTTRNITFDSSYLTGGEPVSAAQMGLNRVRLALQATITSGFSAAFAHCDPLVQADGSMLLRLRAAAGTEVPNATDASTVVVRVTVEGEGA